MAVKENETERLGFLLSKELSAQADAMDDVAFTKWAMAIFGPGVQQAAKTLRMMHDLGMVHTHPHLSNFSCSANGRVYAYDLTNAKLCYDMSRDQFMLRVFNDFRAMYLHAFRLATADTCRPDIIQLMEQNLGIPNFLKPAFAAALGESSAGYFQLKDLRALGKPSKTKIKLNRAMDLVRFFSTLDSYWQPENLHGHYPSELTDEAVQILYRLAGQTYDRLMTEGE